MMIFWEKSAHIVGFFKVSNAIIVAVRVVFLTSIIVLHCPKKERSRKKSITYLVSSLVDPSGTLFKKKKMLAIL